MPDLIVTSTQVLAGADAVLSTKIASVAVTAGQAVYETAGGQWALADANVTVAEAAAKGIAVSGAAANQYCTVVTSGLVTLGAGAAPAAGQPYCVSATAGGIAPDVDVAPGAFYTLLGVGVGANQIRVQILATGVAHA